MQLPGNYEDLSQLILSTSLNSEEILSIAKAHLGCEDCEVCDYAMDEGEDSVTVLLLVEQMDNMDAQTMKFMFDNMDEIAGLGVNEYGHDFCVDLALHPNSGPELIKEAAWNFGNTVASEAYNNPEDALTPAEFSETLQKVASHEGASDQIVREWAAAVHDWSVICDEVEFEDCETCDLALQQSLNGAVRKKPSIADAKNLENKPQGLLARIFGKKK